METLSQQTSKQTNTKKQTGDPKGERLEAGTLRRLGQSSVRTGGLSTWWQWENPKYSHIHSYPYMYIDVDPQSDSYLHLHFILAGLWDVSCRGKPVWFHVDGAMNLKRQLGTSCGLASSSPAFPSTLAPLHFCKLQTLWPSLGHTSDLNTCYSFSLAPCPAFLLGWGQLLGHFLWKALRPAPCMLSSDCLFC